MAQGVLKVVSPQELADREAAEERTSAEAKQQSVEIQELVHYIRTQFREARDARNTTGVSDRMIEALRVFRGQYSPEKLQEIRAFNGSQVYSRITSGKCRAATSILRDLYLSATDRPWTLEPSPEPTIPGGVDEQIQELVGLEVQQLQATGMPVDETMLQERIQQLVTAARSAAVRQAKDAAEVSTKQLNDILVEGRFYQAIREFLIDLPIFPIACLKGPTVRNFSKVRWVDGVAQQTYTPKLFWERVSPLDLYFTPDANDLAQSYVMEHVRWTRQDLHGLIGVAGYEEGVIREALEDFEHGQQSQEWRDWFETERETLEDRDYWQSNRGRLIDGIEWHGTVPGQMLLDFGMDEEKVDDADAEYMVDAWIVDRHAIKVQINPSLDKRPPYYVTSFEKMPGSIYGYGLPDILIDIQSVMNATLRALVNNQSIASGPQVVVNESRLAPTEDGNTLYPWKRWRVQDPDTPSNSGSPVDFFQPSSNANELLGVYEKFSQMADEASAMPRYMTGSERIGGAGRTASGLAMLMENANKVMQNVAANIDDDILMGALERLYEMTMLTQGDQQVLKGDETVVVRGVTVAVQRETDRMRKLEFLQLTANPVDLQIVGPGGRAKILRDVADELGMDGEEIIPSDLEIQAMQAAAAQAPTPDQQESPSEPRAASEQVREPFENQTRGMV